MLILLSLILLSGLLWVLNFQYPNLYLEKTAYSALASTVIYLLFSVLLEELVGKKIKDSKTRYSLRKTISILGIGIFLIALVSIWIAETQNILITVGLIGAAIAFAIQDIFKNFIGGITILLNGLYHVGDRIEINQKYGDVIDISIFYTTLMETREWVSGDQATGRLTMVPNGVILTGTLHNYTRDFDFIWDEITLPITYDSDWNSAATKILDLVRVETKGIQEKAKEIMRNLEGKYYFTARSLEPAIFVTLTDNWITFGIRYITEVRSRRVLHDQLSRKILSTIQQSESIKIASGTINITGLPTLSIKKDNTTPP
ncbi:MAG: mechanosensitive ion channel family protein [Candidatus Bathyarchaeota archaeon]|nr:mechanosensitive ion channel family protein [Candidatus Bathyarchaeota archaeon]